MNKSIELKQNFPVAPSEIYRAWLDSSDHSKMTGGVATCNDNIGEKFSVWDGYINGINIALIPNKQIIQTWRTTAFNDSDDDSELTINLKETIDGCELILMHENIPEGQPDYQQGWIDYYFTPMLEYFT